MLVVGFHRHSMEPRVSDVIANLRKAGITHVDGCSLSGETCLVTTTDANFSSVPFDLEHLKQYSVVFWFVGTHLHQTQVV